jgi:predicted O-methyltransferase YrrM
MKHLSNEEKLAILFRYAKEAGGEAMCVETGTYMGDTTLALFQEPGICGGGVLTVELGEELAYNARSRFDESGAEAIQILQGDSKTALHQHSEVRMDCNTSKSERNKKNFIFI